MPAITQIADSLAVGRRIVMEQAPPRHRPHAGFSYLACILQRPARPRLTPRLLCFEAALSEQAAASPASAIYSSPNV